MMENREKKIGVRKSPMLVPTGRKWVKRRIRERVVNFKPLSLDQEGYTQGRRKVKLRITFSRNSFYLPELGGDWVQV